MTNTAAPKPEALQAILRHVAAVNAQHRQPSVAEMERAGWSKGAIAYLRATHLLGVYAGLYVTREGHEALALADSEPVCDVLVPTEGSSEGEPCARPAASLAHPGSVHTWVCSEHQAKAARSR